MNVPILYVGPPGIGKTAKIKQEADHVEILLLSSMTEEDIAGLPFQTNGLEQRTVPIFIQNIINADKKGLSTILFLDELDKARREVADTLLSLIVCPAQFGIPQRCLIRAAANPPEWGGGTGISDAMLSRFAIVDSMPDPAVVEKILSEYDPRLTQQIMKTAEKHGLVHVSGDGYSRRLTCPRTLEMALSLFTTGEPEAKKLIAGLLTPPFAVLFSTHKTIKQTVKRAKIHTQKQPKKNIIRVALN
jgi:replication-associated recombination protein RarA